MTVIQYTDGNALVRRNNLPVSPTPTTCRAAVQAHETIYGQRVSMLYNVNDVLLSWRYSVDDEEVRRISDPMAAGDCFELLQTALDMVSADHFFTRSAPRMERVGVDVEALAILVEGAIAGIVDFAPIVAPGGAQ